MTRAKSVSLVAEEPWRRLDLFLAARLEGYSRSAAKALIEGGGVRVGGQAASPDRALAAGERVDVEFSQSAWSQDESLEGWVLHEDAHLLVLDKPAGLLMHPLGETWLSRPEAALCEKEPNLAGLLLKRRPQVGRGGMERCGLVHRLDRQTSGVLLVAKTPAAQKALVEDFKQRRIQKLYRAVVRGVPAQARSKVEAPIGREPGHRKVLVTPFGKTAQTQFRVLESAPAAALVEAKPLTGRTHQIRAHLALIGHPVAGDVEFDKTDQPRPPRLMLHAYEVEFPHPGTGKPARFQAPLPADLRAFWRVCRGGPQKPLFRRKTA